MLSIIVAITKNRSIGNNNQLLFHIPEDFKRMQKITTDHPIIMGRKTHESIGKILPKRTNIIITKQKDYQVPGAIITHSLEEAIAKAKQSPGSEEIFIFGGASIYKESLEKDLVDKMYTTLIDEEVDGDVLFPEFDKNKWTIEKELKRITQINKKKIKYKFQTFVKNEI